MQIESELVCEDQKTTKLRPLTLDQEPSTFLDIKKAIEATFSIPVCVQSLLYQSYKISDSERPSEWYLRDGDTLRVVYPTVGECERVVEVFEWLKKLDKALILALTELSGADVYFRLLSDGDYREMGNDIAVDLLYPWIDATKLVNKLHFDFLGGAEVMMSIHQSLITARILQMPLPEVKFMEASCTLFLANFSQTFSLRRRIVELGGLDLCIQSFLSSDLRIGHYGYECEIVRGSLYALCNVSELPEVQLKLAQQTDVTEQAINVATSPLFTCDTSIVSLMYFICLAQCPGAHVYLTRIVGGLHELCEQRKVQRTPPIILMTLESYTCVVISMVVLRSMKCLLMNGGSELERSIKLMQSVCRWDPTLTLSYETQEGLVWATFLPQIIFLYHPVEPVHKQSLTTMTLHTLSTRILLRALLNSFSRQMHVDILVKEGLLEYVVALSWHVPDSCRALALNVLKEISKFTQIRPPSLCSLAKAKLAKSSTGLRKMISMRYIADLC